MKDNILERIHGLIPDSPVKLRRLCEYVIKNCQSVYLMSVAELARESSVGVATVMRLVKALGYESFISFKRDLNSACLEKFTDAETSQSFYIKEEIRDTDSLSYSFVDSIKAIEKTLGNLDRAQFAKINDMLLNSRCVHVLGFRTSRAIASFFCYQLEALLGDVAELGENESLIYDRILRFQDGDVLFIINNYPTVSKATEIVAFCHSLGHPVIVVSDNENNPLLEFADAYLFTAKNESYRYSVLPTLAVLEAIVNEIGIRTAPISIRKINKRDQILREKGVYNTPDKADEE